MSIKTTKRKNGERCRAHDPLWARLCVNSKSAIPVLGITTLANHALEYDGPDPGMPAKMRCAIAKKVCFLSIC